MQVVIVLSALVAVALAGPITPDGDATILRSEFQNEGIDRYQYSFDTSNGISASESGELVNPGTENESNFVRGSYKFLNPHDGITYTVTYVADKDGFHPEGEHLPK